MIPVVAIVGPTATGKTALAVELAVQFQGEIVGADSRQVYRLRDVGTGKPSAAARARERHDDPYGTAGRVLMAYISDKLDRPVSGLTHAGLARLLSELGVDPRLVERIESCLVSGEQGRFALRVATQASGDGLLDEAEELIADLEQEEGFGQ
ncbi:MAG: hypothetical protein IIB12_07330 [Chloroflexi bacterium]|nr:hypothetical protein [Chloroflexota bacterium]